MVYLRCQPSQTLECPYLANLHLEILCRDAVKSAHDLFIGLREDVLAESMGKLKTDELYMYQRKYFSLAIVGLLSGNLPHKEVKEGLQKISRCLLEAKYQDAQSNNFSFVNSLIAVVMVSHLFDEFYVDFGMS